MSMTKESSLYPEKLKSLLEEFGLATYEDGFIVGALFAIVLHLGIIKIVTPLDNILVTVLLIAGILVALNKAFSRGSLISPPWDGFISGFGVILGGINLIEHLGLVPS